MSAQPSNPGLTSATAALVVWYALSAVGGPAMAQPAAMPGSNWVAAPVVPDAERSDCPPGPGDVIYVDDDNTSGPWDGSPEHPYQFIQDGIDNASPGDTIHVRPGTYVENLLVHESVYLNGESPGTTIVEDDGNGTVIDVTANGVQVCGFTVQGGDYWGGVHLHSNENIVTGNLFLDNERAVVVVGSANTISANGIAFSGYYGVVVAHGSNNVIADNLITAGDDSGVALRDGACDNTITGNTIIFNGFFGVRLFNEACNNLVAGNVVRANRNGVRVNRASHNTISGNVIEHNEFDGISLSEATYIEIRDNQMGPGGGVSLDWLIPEPEYWNTHTIENNLVDGAPIYYIKDATGVTAPADAAQVILVDCANCTISDLTLEKARNPIQVAFSSGTLISGNVITSHWYGNGIVLQESNGNTIRDNDLTSDYTVYVDGFASGIYGIYVEDGSANVVEDNRITGFHDGIMLRNWTATADNMFARNDVASFQTGIWLIRYMENECDRTTVADNIVTGCTRLGLGLYDWPHATITNNCFIETGIDVWGDELAHWNTHVITDNTVNGKPLRYYVDQDDPDVDPNAGQIILANCQSVVARSVAIADTTTAILGGFCHYVRVEDSVFQDITSAAVKFVNTDSAHCRENTFQSCGYGFRLSDGDNPSILDNTFEDCETAVMITGSHWARVRRNVVRGSGETSGDGLWLSSLSDAEISNNHIVCVRTGIDLGNSVGNDVTENTVAGCRWYGVYVDYDSVGNLLIRNELVANGTNAFTWEGGHNVWTSGLDGNFWSDFEQNPGYPDFYIIPSRYGDPDYDYSPLDRVTQCPFTCGDLDGSCGAVDLADLAAFLACLGHPVDESTQCRCADLDGDDVVDLDDLATFLALYGTTSPCFPPDCWPCAP